MERTHSAGLWTSLVEYYYGSATAIDPDAFALVDTFDGIEDVEGRDIASAVESGRVDRAEVEHFLTTGVPVPSGSARELGALFDHIDAIGAAVDLSAAGRGAECLRSIPPTLLWVNALVLGGAFSACDPRVGMAVSLNQKVIDNATKRFAETAMYFRDMMVQRGYTRPGAGVATSTRVRMVHSFVASAMNRDPDWPYERYGTPVPVSSIAFTGIAFGVMGLRYAEMNGMRFTDRQKEDVAAYSAVTNHLMGCPVRLVTALGSYEAALAFVKAYLSSAPLPRDGDVDRLCGIVDGFFGTGGFPISENAFFSRLFNRHLAARIRVAFGDRASAAFRIPADDGWSVAGELLFGAMNTVLARGTRVPGLGAPMARLSARFWGVSVPKIYQQITGNVATTYDDLIRT